MSSPYVPVSITGYNSSPPSDDGSEIESNALKWSNHTEKIGDPLKAAIEQVNTNVADAFTGIYGQTQAEADALVTPTNYYSGAPVYDLRRAGLVPNSSASAASNTTLLQGLLAPDVVGPTGVFVFPNTTGSDTYYFNSRIPCRDGVHIDLAGCTLDFTKTGDSDDTNGGCFHTKRDFSLVNGSLDINYTQSTGTNTFNAIAIAGRDGSTDFSSFYDSLEPSPFGNIVLRNLRIDMSGGTNSSAIFGLGGIQNVIIENVRIEGNGTLKSGLFYEFGFATNEAAAADRQTSHAHNWSLRNVVINNIDNTGGVLGTAVRFAGAYAISIDGLRVDHAFTGVSLGTGESLFYRPWVGVDDIGTSRWITIRNANFSSVDGTVMNFDGATANTGYLSGVSIPDEQLTDLISVDVNGFIIDSTDADSAGIGVSFSTGHTSLRNGQVIGCAKGIVASNEAVHFEIDNVDVYDSGTIGVQIGLDSNVFDPRRLQMGTIRNSHIAGSGSTSANSAIVADYTQMLLVENCRFGYSTGHDGVAETTQTGAINAGANAIVVAKDCYVAGVSAGNAYLSSTGADATVINPMGVRTASGLWKTTPRKSIGADVGDANATLTAGTSETVQRWATALTANRTITLNTSNAIKGDTFRVVRTGLGAFTLDVGGLKTIPSATAAFADVEYDGAAWVLTGYGAL